MLNKNNDLLTVSKVESKVRRLAASYKGYLAKKGFIIGNDLKRLRALKDIHKGKTAFLVGNGPSVKTTDLEKLPTGGISFCCNRFSLAYGSTSFRPTYTLASDRQTISDFGQQIVNEAESEVIICSLIKPNFSGDFIWLCQQYDDLFSNVYRGAMPGGGTLIVAIQLAWHMGIKDFVLYGVDHNYPNMVKTDSEDIYYSAVGEGNHFIPNYRSGKPWCPPIVEEIESSFTICKNHINKNGGSIFNATSGGKLEIFDRVSISKYFEK